MNKKLNNNPLHPTRRLGRGAFFIFLILLTPAFAQERIHPRVAAYMEKCNEHIGDPSILRMADTLERMSLELKDTTGIVSAPVLPFHYYLHSSQEDSLDYYASLARETALRYHRNDYYFMVMERWISYQAGRRRYSVALRELDDMHHMAIELDDPNGLLSCYKNLALIYYYRSDYAQALDNIRQAIATSRTIKDNDYETGLCYVELGRILNKAGRYQECIDELQKAIPAIDRRLRSQGENDMMMALMHSMLASAQVAAGDLDGAGKSLQVVASHMREGYNYFDIMKAHSDYLCAKGRYSEALQWQSRFYEGLGSTHTLSYYRDMSDILAHIPGREKEAARLAHQYVLFADSVQAAEHEAHYAEIAADMELSRLESDSQRLRLRATQALATASLLLLIVVVVFSLRYYRLWRRMKNAAPQQVVVTPDLGQQIQASMLRHEHPDHPRYELFASLSPAPETGGDLYDYLEHNGRLYLIVADVSGKGTQAALYMSVLTYLFRQQVPLCDSVAQLMNNINRLLTACNPGQMYATALCGMVELSSGDMTLCNAGHIQPLGMTRPDAGAPYTLRHCDLPPYPPLGADAKTYYTEQKYPLRPGDKMFLYTDGLLRTEDPQHIPYGANRLTALLTANANTTAQEIINIATASVRKYAQGTPQSDDITMLAFVYKQ